MVNLALGQDQGNDEALKLARKLTEEGAKTFNTADAKAMAAYYVEDAKMFLQSKEEDEISEKEYAGREEIEKFYADIFKNPATIQAKNTVEYAKTAGPGHPGDRGHVRAQRSGGQAAQGAVLPGPRQAWGQVADSSFADLCSA